MPEPIQEPLFPCTGYKILGIFAKGKKEANKFNGSKKVHHLVLCAKHIFHSIR